MNFIDFTKNGGYRLKQFTLRKMQESWFEILKAFVAFCNVPETGNYIIAGMKVVGANITAGYAYIDGELCRFEQTPGTASNKIKKNVVLQTLGFKNGNNEEVFRYVTAVVHATEGTALSSFVRVSPVFDANYVHTDTNFTQAEKDKLLGIEEGAEVNVQADWNETSETSDAFIKNKPIIQNILKSGTVLIGDISDNVDYPISFPDVGTTNYYVEVFHECTVNSGNTVTNTSVVNAPLVHSKTSNSFKIRYRDPIMSVQGLRIYYNIVAL